MTQIPAKKRRKKWPWIVLIVLLIAIAAILLTAGQKATRALNEETAQKRDIETYYSFSGNLTPVTDEIQTAKSALKVKELYVREGDTVTEGQPLLRGTDGTRVYAAHTGTIETLFAETDDQLQPGAQIARIVDYDTLEVSVDVDEYDIGAVTVGKEGSVYLNAVQETVTGTVSDIARSATTEGGVSYYRVKLQLKAVHGARSGMSVEVNLLDRSAPQAVSVSLSALSYDEYNKPFVYKKDAEGKLGPVYVQTGVSDGRNIQITSGLEEGETVYYHSNDMARFFAMQQRMMSNMSNMGSN